MINKSVSEFIIHFSIFRFLVKFIIQNINVIIESLIIKSLYNDDSIEIKLLIFFIIMPGISFNYLI